MTTYSASAYALPRDTLIHAARDVSLWAAHCFPSARRVRVLASNLATLSHSFAMSQILDAIGLWGEHMSTGLNTADFSMLRRASAIASSAVGSSVQVLCWLHEIKVIDIGHSVSRFTVIGALADSVFSINAIYDASSKCCGNWAENLRTKAEAKALAETIEALAKAAFSLAVAGNGLSLVVVSPVTLLALSTLSLIARLVAEYSEYLFKEELGSGYSMANERLMVQLKTGHDNIERPQNPGFLFLEYARVRPRYFLVSLRKSSTWLADIIPMWLVSPARLKRFATNIQHVEGGFAITAIISAANKRERVNRTIKVALGMISLLSWLHTTEVIFLGAWRPHVVAARASLSSLSAISTWWNKPRNRSLLTIARKVRSDEGERGIYLNVLVKEMASRISTVVLLLLNGLAGMRAPSVSLLQVGSILGVTHYLEYSFGERVKVLEAQKAYGDEEA